MEIDDCSSKVSMCHDSMEDTRELVEAINTFPTDNQTISDTTLKDMLFSLCDFLHADMMDCMGNFKAEVSELGGRIDHVQKKFFLQFFSGCT